MAVTDQSYVHEDNKRIFYLSSGSYHSVQNLLSSLLLSENKDYSMQDCNCVSLILGWNLVSHVREEHVVDNNSLHFILKLRREVVDWINLAQGRDRWRRYVVNSSVNFRGLWNAASLWVAEVLVASLVGLLPMMLVSCLYVLLQQWWARRALNIGVFNEVK